MGEEQRRFQRVPVPLALSCRRVGSLTDVWRQAALLDLSAGGVSFESQEPYEPSEVLGLELHLPGASAPLALRGRVVRSLPRPAGVTECAAEFIGVTPTQQAGIDDLVAFLKRRPG